MPPDQPSPSAPSGVLQSAQPDIGPAAKPLAQLVIEVVAVVLVLIGGVGVAFAMYYFQHHGIAILQTAKHSSTTPSSHAAPPSPQTSPPPAPAPAPAPAASSVPPPAPLPPTLTLTNQDNGRTVTISVGTIVTTQLAQQAGVTGYHWNGLALSYRTWQLASVKRFGSNFSLVHGADGSIRESSQIAAAGDFTLGYSDIPNCQPGCNQQPLQLWEVHIHVP